VNTASEIAAQMTQNPALRIALDGYRVSGPTRTRGQNLSDRRINTVRAAVASPHRPVTTNQDRI
jgi:outer membrane protein OmpA-like peptidoglycan-associated protein